MDKNCGELGEGNLTLQIDHHRNFAVRIERDERGRLPRAFADVRRVQRVGNAGFSSAIGILKLSAATKAQTSIKVGTLPGET